MLTGSRVGSRAHDGAAHGASGEHEHLRSDGGLGRHVDPVEAVRRGGRGQCAQSGIASKDYIKPLIESASGVKAKHEEFHKALDDWWMHNVPLIKGLPVSQNVFKLRREFLTSIAAALVPQGMLDLHQIRGAFAAYMNRLAADFKSVAASGCAWPHSCRRRGATAGPAPPRPSGGAA